MDLQMALLLSAVIIILSIFWRIWNSIKTSGSLPPGPRGLPVLGYLPFIREDLHNQLTELAHKYGPIYKLWLGKKLCIVISSPALIKDVVRDYDTVFANRDKSIAASVATFNANDIAWCPYGLEWRERRKLFVHEMLSNSTLDASYNLRKDEVRKAVRHVYSKIGTRLEICELAFMVDVNVMMSMVWGTTIEGESRDKIAAAFLPDFEKGIDLLGKPNISDYFPILARFDIQGVEKELKCIMKRIEQTIEDVIDDRTKSYLDKEHKVVERAGRKDFVQILVELKEKEDDVKVSLTKTQMIAMIVNTIVGGTDTSSTTVEWVMAELLANPDMMEKVQKELAEVVGLNNIVEEFHIPKLTWLDAVLKETMRLHPTLPFLIPRTPSESCTVGGYTIPKDSGIFLNVWSVQRDPLAFENPLEFKPERFLDNTGKWDFRGNDFNYLPFGSGRRVCPGLPLAERMVRYVLASLLHSFDWQLPEGEKIDLSDKFGLVLRKKTPLYATPVPRLPHSSLYE